MLAELVVRRRLRKFFDAFEAKDFDAMSGAWSKNIVLEFPAGLPMAGEWRGREEVRRLFEAIFAYNTRLTMTLEQVAVSGAWSPRGNGVVLAEWRAEEVRPDGHRLDVRIVSVAESRRWRTVRSRDYFVDIPAVAAHYEHIELPARGS